jgi:hypothetical protein
MVDLTVRAYDAAMEGWPAALKDEFSRVGEPHGGRVPRDRVAVVSREQEKEDR